MRRLLIIATVTISLQLFVGMVMPSPLEYGFEPNRLFTTLLDGLLWTLITVPTVLFIVLVDRAIALKDTVQKLLQDD